MSCDLACYQCGLWLDLKTTTPQGQSSSVRSLSVWCDEEGLLTKGVEVLARSAEDSIPEGGSRSPRLSAMIINCQGDHRSAITRS